MVSSTLVASSLLPITLAMAKGVQRKPMGRREAALIKNMKKVGRLPVLTIAKIVERNKTTVYKVTRQQMGQRV